MAIFPIGIGKHLFLRRKGTMAKWILNQVKQFREPFPEIGSLAYNLLGLSYDLQIFYDKIRGRKPAENPDFKDEECKEDLP